jgi:hypothetical protein
VFAEGETLDFCQFVVRKQNLQALTHDMSIADSIATQRLALYDTELPESDMSRERLREGFRPAKVRVLFVGESPPASGRFFYARDSGLYRAMREAFHVADASVNDDNFLAVFRTSGCYLVDLCADPVDRLGAWERRAACSAGEVRLTATIAELRPAVIGILLKSIASNVGNSIALAGWRGEVIQLPYPGRWVHHRKAFVEMLGPVIAGERDRRRLCPGVLPDIPGK